jgi:aryl-alcohol dehydrogenase
MKIRAAVIERANGPFQIQDVELEAPRSGEIIVKLAASGICFSDITARNLSLPLPLPIVLGHEGAGIVHAIGPGVTKVAVGDAVVLSRMACGKCPNCMAGDTNFCHHAIALNLSGVRADGTSPLSREGAPVFSQFCGQSSFANYALAHERNATPLDTSFDLKLAPAFACGVLTGAGAVLNGLRVEAGSSLAVFGTGSVGLASVMAAHVAGCAQIIAVDRNLDRLRLAQELGATHAILAEEGVDFAAEIRRIAPLGVSNAIEATGVASIVRAAVDSLAQKGVCALLGVHKMGQEIHLDHTAMALAGTAVQGFPTGVSEPDVLIPRLIALHRQGRFPVDRLVTFFRFDDIQSAIEACEQGRAVKPILLMD